MKDSLGGTLVIDGIVTNAIVAQTVTGNFFIEKGFLSLGKRKFTSNPVTIHVQRLLGQLRNLLVARSTQGVVQKGLNALINGRTMFAQQTTLFAVDTKQVRSHIQEFIAFIGRLVHKALSGQLDGNHTTQGFGVHVGGLTSFFVETNIAAEFRFLACGDHHFCLVIFVSGGLFFNLVLCQVVVFCEIKP